MTDFKKGFILYIAMMMALVLTLLLIGCTPFITEFSDSSGCFYSTGGPAPGLPSGVVLVCRSGKDGAEVKYSDDERQISIKHGPN